MKILKQSPYVKISMYKDRSAFLHPQDYLLKKKEYKLVIFLVSLQSMCEQTDKYPKPTLIDDMVINKNLVNRL